MCQMCVSFLQAYSSATSHWQVMLQRSGEQLKLLNVSDAHEQGYVFHLTDGRLVFRTPYGQPDALSTTVNRHTCCLLALLDSSGF